VTTFDKNKKMMYKLPFIIQANSYTLLSYVIFFLQCEYVLMGNNPKHVANLFVK